MLSTGIVESFFLIFTGAAVLATAALYTRQPLLVAYIAIGCILGPHGFALVSDPELLSEIAEIGIIFLLFLVGLDLPPSKLKNMVGKSLLTALGTTAAFFLIGFGLMLAFEFSLSDAVVTGIAVTFSSTIIGIKLLPTTALHHRHIGEIVVSLLLIQDLLAILALILLSGQGDSLSATLSSLGTVLIALPLLVGAAIGGVRLFVQPLIQRFDAFHEFIFLLALGWCLGIASLAEMGGLSFEIGAFVAGVSLATSPIAQYIAESLRPLRDFFLVLFFFSVGAELDILLLGDVLFPTLLLALALVALKPGVFALLLTWQGEAKETSWEVGYRLGQASEFSLLLSYVAASAALVSIEAAHVIQGATVITLLLSSYAVIFRYPSPIAISERLRRD
ncbi:MAG: cation:proton antiporter [Gammaproteobacteria bacterium]|nr:cation:proton antiporter [Gammaproteobacteria bacterium]